jgi:hypothetical protein
MQDGVLNLCRVKLRDQQRLARTGVMKEYPQYPHGKFGSAVPRAANASGGGQPGTIVKCKGWENDPNAYLYFIAQAPVWKEICAAIGGVHGGRARLRGLPPAVCFGQGANRVVHLRGRAAKVSKRRSLKENQITVDRQVRP